MKQLPKIYRAVNLTNVSYATNTDSFRAYANQKAVKTFVGDSSVTYNVGTLTGVTATDADNGEMCVQYIEPSGAVYFTSVYGLILKGVNTNYTIKATNKAKELLEYNKEVLEDILLASEFVGRLEKKGYDCSSYRAEIRQLYSRLENRQNYIIAYSDSDKYAEPKLLSNSLYNIVNGNAISIAISTVIVISVVVTAAVSSLAWFVFYTYAGEAKSDCRKSKELNKILANVDPETREELYRYIDKYADSFYKRAVRRTKAENLWGTFKYLFVAGGAGYIIYNLINKNE